MAIAAASPAIRPPLPPARAARVTVRAGRQSGPVAGMRLVSLNTWGPRTCGSLNPRLLRQESRVDPPGPWIRVQRTPGGLKKFTEV
mgnify:CR=1 FL=1